MKLCSRGCNISWDTPDAAYILSGPASHHIVRERLQFVLVNEVFDQAARAVSAVAAISVISSFFITYDRFHIFILFFIRYSVFRMHKKGLSGNR